MLFSIIIRTFNEEKYLSQLLDKISSQNIFSNKLEVIIVDSGSIDNTLAIAEMFNCRIIHINKKIFSFGRSLNFGCNAALGDILIFISGHCIPIGENWLINLVEPIIEKKVVYSYGKQIGNNTSKFSETVIFEKYYPNESRIPQIGYFCNNANSALLKSEWENKYFDENLTGLEDMFLAKNLVEEKKFIGYVANACVYHLHNESWSKIKLRFERESIALQNIMPEVYITFFDFLRFFLSSVFIDISKATKLLKLHKFIFQILLYRFCQYWGSYKGNHSTREISKKLKYRYFYPK